MEDPDREKIKQILSRALLIRAEQRESLLEELCPEDATAKDEVRRLLSLHDEAVDFLIDPAFSVLPPCLPSPGERLEGRYLLEAIIGVGSFGTVYRAVDTKLAEKRVAVKVLHEGIFSEASLQREIEALSKVEHPGVAGILDAGVTEQGSHFLVTRYVDGENLRDHLKRVGRLNQKKVISIARELASALEAAHDKGILHLDLKPENIILQDTVTGPQRAFIIDFGVSVFVREDMPVPETFGSSAVYRPPEFGCQQPSPVFDLYSLAVIIREILTGSTTEGRPPLRWRRFFRKALARDPVHRFQSASDFHRAIPVPWRSVALAAGGALAAVLAMATAPFHDRSAVNLPAPVPLTTFPGWETYPSFSPDGEYVFFAWDKGDSKADVYVRHIATGHTEQLTQSEAKETHPACSPDGKDVAFLRDIGENRTELIVMSLVSRAERTVLRGRINSLAWSPDGRSIFLAISPRSGRPHEIRRIDLEANDQTQVTDPLPTQRGDIHPAVSPDGRQLAFVRFFGDASAGLLVLDLDREGRPVGEPQPLTRRPHTELASPVWTPDGEKILFLTGIPTNRTMAVVEASGSAPPQPLLPGIGRLDFLAISYRHWRLAISQSQTDHNIHRYQLNQPGGSLRGHSAVVASTWSDQEPQIAPDQNTVAFVSNRSGDEQVWLTDMEGTFERELKLPSSFRNVAALWLPGSFRLVTSGAAEAGPITLLMDTETQTVRSLLPDATAYGLSRDGRSIYATKRGSGLWRFSVTGTAQERMHPSLDPRRVIESVDGRRIFYCTRVGDDGVGEIIGGRTVKLIDRITRRAFTVGQQGVYYISSRSDPVVRLYRFDSQRHVELFRLEKPPSFGIHVSEDERTIVLAQEDHFGADLLLIDNFSM